MRSTRSIRGYGSIEVLDKSPKLRPQRIPVPRRWPDADCGLPHSNVHPSPVPKSTPRVRSRLRKVTSEVRFFGVTASRGRALRQFTPKRKPPLLGRSGGSTIRNRASWNDYEVLPVAVPLTLALALNEALTLTDDEAAAVTWPAKVAAADKQAVPCAVRSEATVVAVVAILPMAVAAALPWAATCTSTGRFASSVVFSMAEAVPVTVTLTAGFVQTIFADADPSQPALQFAAASHLGGVRATSHDGAVNATEHEPEQLP